MMPPAGCGSSSATALLTTLLVQPPQKEYTLYNADFNKAIQIDPSLTAAHANLGVVYYQMGQFAKQGHCRPSR